MSAANLVMSAAGGTVAKTYVDDVFSAYTYTGNGSTQTINNGIDLAGEGGMVWIKNRETAGDNCVFDTVRGPTGSGSLLRTNLTNASGGGTFLTGFTSSGFSLDTANYVNESTKKIVSWTFRKAPKFFDVVTYTGDGTTNRLLPHSLGIIPGMVIVKKTSTTSNWPVHHRSQADAFSFGTNLCTNEAYGVTQLSPILAASATDVTLNKLTEYAGSTDANANGVSYVAYLFAHDTSTDGIIQCGSFTLNGSSHADVNLGWEPQYILAKRTDAASDWTTIDASRGMPASSASNLLTANSSAAEVTTSYAGNPTATGFTFDWVLPSTPFIYLAIRRPNKPPTTGTQVFEAATFTGNGATQSVGTLPGIDLAIFVYRTATFSPRASFFDRLRGDGSRLRPSGTLAEATQPLWMQFTKNAIGVTVGPDSEENASTYPRIGWLFKRAPGFMDVVCYTGTGSATTVAHGLGVVPELMIVKARSPAGGYWAVYPNNPLKALFLNLSSVGGTNATYWNNTAPTSSVITVGSTGGDTNEAGYTYVTYLFATLPGISKVGSYTGNGSSQTINCGFTTGARFILIKRTDSTGDWYVWSSATGIVSANDPHLSLNTTAAEVTTDDSIDPNVVGFDINQVAATNINVTSATYIFLSVA